MLFSWISSRQPKFFRERHPGRMRYAAKMNERLLYYISFGLAMAVLFTIFAYGGIWGVAAISAACVAWLIGYRLKNGHWIRYDD